ncbi:MAG TPA: TolC family protein [Oligoflexus sp.]|uniref:TolC family protein n=1 Tax=Oligoflexus sp. TaxID=1971216 RepID=UPI002D7F9DB9|nr:TolC family protein [Oligoflexus sp.]HET9239352.1 TolC family protein [Oligoflexus sp.]
MMPTKYLSRILWISLAWILPLQASAASDPRVRLVKKGSGLSLDEAMQRAEKESSALKSLEAARQASEARADQAGDSKGPRLSLEAQRAWIDTDVNKLAGKTLPNGIRNPDNVNTAGVVVTQPLTGWFALNNKEEAEQHLTEAARADYEASVQDLRSRSAETFLRVLKATRLRDIARQSLGVIQKQKNDAEALRRQGKLAQLDFDRFSFAESEAITQLSDAESQLLVAAAALREQINLPADQELVLEDIESQTTVNAQNHSDQRSELRSAAERAEAFKSYRAAAQIDYYPTVNAFARFDRDFAAEDIVIPIPGAPTYPKEDYRDRFTYGLSLNWVLWDGLARKARVRELTAESERVTLQRAALASNLRIEEAQTAAEYDKAQQTLRNAEVSARLSEEIFEAFTAKFQNGLATTTDVLSAERDLTRARAQLASTGYDLQMAAIRYNRAHGSKL